jgi:hypothetical protein
MAGFCDSGAGLQTPKFGKWEANLSKVSGRYREYSRFREAGARDRKAGLFVNGLFCLREWPISTSTDCLIQGVNHASLTFIRAEIERVRAQVHRERGRNPPTSAGRDLNHLGGSLLGWDAQQDR